MQSTGLGSARREAAKDIRSKGLGDDVLKKVTSSLAMSSSYLNANASDDDSNDSDDNDMSSVRVHRSSGSKSLDSALGANAFASGGDIHLRPSMKKELSAHELTHVVQQGPLPKG